MSRNHAKVIDRLNRADARRKCREKVRYEDFRSAKSAALVLQQKHALRFPPAAYCCETCGGHHLTSKTPGR